MWLARREGASRSDRVTRAAASPEMDVELGSSATFDASDYFEDPDGDELTYAATSSGPANATASVSGSTVTVTAIARGMATITVIARDPEGLSAQQSFQVAVRNSTG